jgi:uncharacterized protein (DUF1015 family)
MAEILPFRALRYNPEIAGNLERLVTQPYDKITEAMQRRYLELSPYNLARIIRGLAEPGDSPLDNVYTRAAGYFEDWISRRILVTDRAPAIYPYHQEYSLPGQAETRHTRRGLVALLHLEDYRAGIVFRHEETFAGPKADRLELLKATRVHAGQIFMLYSDPERAVERLLERRVAGPPLESVGDELGTRHTVWREDDPATLERVVEALRPRPLVIADGHHRYETALAYRDLCRAQGAADARAEYVMVTLVRKESAGLTILPTHRVVHGLEGFDWKRLLEKARRRFEVEEHPQEAPSGESFLDRLRKAGSARPAFAAFAGRGRLALLRLRAEPKEALPDLPESLARLDAVILHRLLLEEVLGINARAVREERNLAYRREAQEAAAEVEGGGAQVCFLVNPTPVEDVWENALAGQALPQKSTDFYPKLLSGLALYWLDNPAGL